MSSVELTFKLFTDKNEFEKLYNYDVDVFAESPDLQWSVDSLKNESENGWRVYSVQVGDEIVAAAFLKEEDGKLLTKNTPIKLLHQGNGYSHVIKEFFENEAQKNNISKVINICPIDNFRMISLNETHGYKKTGNIVGDGKSLIEWVKDIKGDS
jgi:predicted GNAT family acetyltransferase